MAYVFQTVNKKTKKPHPKWRFQYTAYDGTRKTGTGFPSKIETEKLAFKVEAEHDEIRKGYREPPSKAQKFKNENLRKIADEYFAWGKSQGGRGGGPWGKDHERKRRSLLAWWEKKLSLEHLSDLDGILINAEKSLQALQAAGLSGKTLNNYSEALHSFCRWCVTRNYLSENPLKDLKKFNATPEVIRRAMTLDEIHKLFSVAPPFRKLLYEVAFCSGLRANELRSLTIDDLDIENNGLRLRAKWTKNRKEGFQSLSKQLVKKLADNYYNGVARAKNIILPENALLYVPSHPARELDKDLVSAEIPKHTSEGKIDFHACRTAYITLLMDSTSNPKEVQSLARHSNLSLTMDTYARTRENRLADISEQIGDKVLIS